jgi:hypothetical protein
MPFIIYPAPPAPIPVYRTRTIKFLVTPPPPIVFNSSSAHKCSTWKYFYPDYCTPQVTTAEQAVYSTSATSIFSAEGTSTVTTTGTSTNCITGGAWVPKVTVCGPQMLDNNTP